VAIPHLNVLSFLSSIFGAAAVLVWRIRETRTPVSFKKIVIPPLGMATGFAMFAVPMFRVPLTWAIEAFALGALILAYPLLRTSRLTREGDAVMMQRSNMFLAVILVLAAVRIAARGYLDTVLTVQQTAGLFFILAFGMILRWRAQMLIEYRSLSTAHSRRNA
jgi:membrane protein CcdC involved in cytochrome C biogenesis